MSAQESGEGVVRVAVIGAGPAGFYVAGALLRHERHRFAVDLFERLPTPWGLVRAGVAPDHQNIKAVARAFERIARMPGFRFVGNVELGTDVELAALREAYDAVVIAIGAAVDRRLGIPGEELAGSHGAGEFVGWYNAHPDYAHLDFDLSHERAVVIGNGNVAADVARILLTPAERLAATDISDRALARLRESAIREVVIVGRRGPAEAAFTNPELRELGAIPGCAVVVAREELELEEPSRLALERSADATRRRNLATLREFAERGAAGEGRRLRLLFRRSPVRLLGVERVEAIELERNELVAGSDGRVVARPTGQRERLACGLVLRAIGYRTLPIAGLPFDAEHGVVPNLGGRVVDPAGEGQPVPGLYVAGWAKRGPTGVIGTNKQDAQETVAALLEDLEAGVLPRAAGLSRDPLESLSLAGAAIVDYAGWLRIDTVERERGRSAGRPRVKLTTRDELLRHALGGVNDHAVGDRDDRLLADRIERVRIEPALKPRSSLGNSSTRDQP